MNVIRPEEWRPIDGMELEKAAIRTVKSKSNILVVAGPGAGKTELLAQKAAYLFNTNICEPNRKILAISYKKDSASNLKDRVVKRCGDEVASRFVSLTFDAFAKTILDQFKYALPIDYKLNINYYINCDDIIDAAFQTSGYNLCNESNFSKKNYYKKIISEVNLPLDEENREGIVWRKLMSGFGNNNACLTFEMISKLATFIIKINPKVRKALQITYSHVFLDEFQDTTALQYSLIKECFHSSNSLITAVGDSKQRIMAWAGASETIFEDFCRDFLAEREQLIMNHRSAPRLIELQKAMYDSLDEKNHLIKFSKKWKPEDGEIKLFISDNNNREVDALVEDIKARLASGKKANDICILCKQKVRDYTKGLIIKLGMNNIKARIDDEYQNLIKEPIVELFLLILKNSACNNPKEWAEMMRRVECLCGWDDEYNNDKYYRFEEELNNFLCNVSKIYCSSKCDVNNLVKLMLEYLCVDRIKAFYPIYRQGHYLEEKCSKFIELFDKELNSANHDMMAAINSFLGLDSIPIMTIHKSKGLEYDIVYFIGLEDYAFWNFKNEPKESRSTFFVALSRAKNSVIFTFCKYRNKFKYPKQRHEVINEFYQLLQKDGMADVIEFKE